MAWRPESITSGEIQALHETARRAWSEDTRYPLASESGDSGQCYVTAYWLVDRLGGYLGRSKGHYAWLSPDKRYVLDICNHENGWFYGKNSAFQGVPVHTNSRVRRFVDRANQIFDNLDHLLKHADMTGDAFPGEEPQRSEDLNQEHQYWHDEPEWEPAQGEYFFVYGNGSLEVSPFHKHDELAQHARLSPDHAGPMAMGYITVTNNKATWEVDSNMNVKGLDRIFRDYSKHVGWDWGGVTNVEGEPISDEFAPKKGKTLHYVYDESEDHLWLGNPPVSELTLRSGSAATEGALHSGRLRVVGRCAYAQGAVASQGCVRSLYDYCEDSGLILYAWNDNVLKKIPDLQQFNFGDPNADQPDEHQYPEGPTDEREPSGVYKCPNCDRLFPGWYEYQNHRREENDDYGEPVEDGKFPENDMDATFPTHFTEQQPVTMPVVASEAARVDGYEPGEGEHFVAYHCGSPIGYVRMKDGQVDHILSLTPTANKALISKMMVYAEKEPKDLLEAPMPFIYDIQDDQITIGQAGTRTSDIPGKFTPGGILEGTYQPGGKVVVRSMTNMPYTVRHLIQLWYYQHPELTVKNVFLQDDAGGTTKLADTADVGGQIMSLVAADPAVHSAAQVLRQAGGKVYAVGGAVRDAVMGKEPKDIDLMVQGLEPAEVNAALNSLPGRTDVTGKDFGVFRYRQKGNDVEVALPRKERSTGAGHRDFEVHADPHLSPEEDFYRRDFSANAMGVDLNTGQLVDPYGGMADIQRGVLRAHNPDSLKEDPLRVVRGLVANARHGLVPDDSTREQMAANAGSLEHLAPERVQAELDKLFAAKNPHLAIRLAQDTGVLPYILPEVSSAFGYNQNNPHHELELGEHLVKVLARISQKTDDPDLRLAALLHDIGKPSSAWVDPDTGMNHFYKKITPDGKVLGADHETVGAEMTSNLMNRLRYPADRTKRVSELVQHHMWPAFSTQRGARRFLNRVQDHADDLMTLRWADQGGKNEYDTDPGLNLSMQQELMDRVRNEGQPTNRGQLAIDGNDLIRLGVPAGPQIGTILQQLTEAALEDPSVNNREQLLTMAQTYAKL